MSASVDDVAICNRALRLLKQANISSIASPTTAAENICADTYDDSRLALLRLHPWNFAIKRTTVTANVTSPTFGWENAYDLPNDFVRLLTIGDDSIKELRDKFELENGQILGSDLTTTTDSTINLRYIFDVTDPVKFDATFVRALVYLLALDMAFAFSVSKTIYDRIEVGYEKAMAQAVAADGQERPPTRIQKSKWLRARRQRPIVADKFTRFD